MWEFLSFGIVLGASAGVSPGPLLTVVIAHTLRHHVGEGIKVAVAPLITDLLIIALALWVFTRLPDPRSVLGVVSFVGAAVVCYIGVTSLRQGPVEGESRGEAPRSLLSGVLVNALSPHPYLFWFAVGVPTIIKAHHQSLPAAVVFVVAFFAARVGSKMAVALAVDRSKGFLSSAVYLWVLRLLGLCLIGFALLLVWDGCSYLGLI